jgi:hypothetical protein
MNAKLKRRLDVLEKNNYLKRASAIEEIVDAALSALSDEDLERLRPFAGREAPFSGCTPATTTDVVVERWQTLSAKKAKLDSDGRCYDDIARERRKEHA